MLVRAFSLALAAIFFALASTGPTPAVVKKNLPAPASAKPTKNAPLTEGECRGLGGDVVTTSGCATGTACQTADKNGVLHRVCMDNKKN